MKNHAFFALFMFGSTCVVTANAGVSSLNGESTIRPVSQYGLIQNVQDYSTNPFWNKNSPYNQKFPQAVYVTGPELSTAECQSAVGSLVSTYCAANNDCVDVSLSDIRPFIMLQLSRMPGHNYATSCSGYIDSEFDAYVSNHLAAVPNTNVSFPGATDANPNFNAPAFQLENPYAHQDGTWNGQEWQKEKKERSKELKDLQSQNGAGSERIAKSEFPTTFADLSFSERNEIKSAGYEPYKDSSAYKSISVESYDKYIERQNQLASFGTDAYSSNPNNRIKIVLNYRIK